MRAVPRSPKVVFGKVWTWWLVRHEGVTGDVEMRGAPRGFAVYGVQPLSGGIMIFHEQW